MKKKIITGIFTAAVLSVSMLAACTNGGESRGSIGERTE